MKILDISHDITTTHRGFPQEPSTVFNSVCEISPTNCVKVSQLSLSSHAATHIDAPSHYIKNGLSVDELPLNIFLGQCVVIDMMHVTDCIEIEHIQHISLSHRVLFKTKSQHLDFTSISPNVVAYLARHGVKLIGTSAISIDPVDSKALLAHVACAAHNIHIVESLKLDDVLPGIYTFIGLPLKLVGVDASPIRAVLIEGMMNECI